MESEIKALFDEHGGYITRRHVDRVQLDPHVLTRLVKAGEIERIQRGVYRLPNTPIHQHEDLIEVSLRIPYGIVCLSSALAFHGLTTFIPKAVHLAVPQKRKPPVLQYPPLKIHYFSAKTYTYGIEEHQHHGNTVQVYDVEKTLVDLFRFKEKTLFAEGLQKYLSRSEQPPNLTKLIEAAALGRVKKRMHDLLEVLPYDIAI